ncbi:hypothetical protein [Thioclava dalianensis]|uniref:hypothetical protein n=1 Tax=Thioclava dalianensis TaxID=1185766 RepID=UPI0015A5DF2F|nr:hypothetical protein [Thioclava dalianensis]
MAAKGYWALGVSMRRLVVSLPFVRGAANSRFPPILLKNSLLERLPLVFRIFVCQTALYKTVFPNLRFWRTEFQVFGANF